MLFQCKLSLLFSSVLALIPTLFPTVPATIAVSYTLFHSSILLSLFLWLALHLWLSNIILHLASFSAQHHWNSYHYKPQLPSLSCTFTLSQTTPPPPLLPVSLLSFLTYVPTCSLYKSFSPPCPHFLPCLLLYISLYCASERKKMISCHVR